MLRLTTHLTSCHEPISSSPAVLRLCPSQANLPRRPGASSRGPVPPSRRYLRPAGRRCPGRFQGRSWLSCSHRFVQLILAHSTAPLSQTAPLRSAMPLCARCTPSFVSAVGIQLSISPLTCMPSVPDIRHRFRRRCPSLEPWSRRLGSESVRAFHVIRVRAE